MHCHVLMHMDDGMMGSLLIVNGGELFTPLPVGTVCSQAPPNTIGVADFQFTPNSIMVPSGTTVTFDFQGGTHTVKTVSVSSANPITINNGGGDLDPVPTPSQKVVTVMGSPGGQINYQCGIHGAGMSGTIMIM
jgi:plastocyanin